MLVTSDEIRALTAAFIRPDLVIFPVRHHSPACAWSLRQAFARLAPALVLVEGPRSFNRLIPLLTSPKAQMPLAIYSYVLPSIGTAGTETHRAAYYPFCDYSPELVALREALARGIPARFIDLDFAEQAHLETTDVGAPESLLAERYYRRSSYLKSVAEECGCRDHEELWEHLFEASIGTEPLERHLERITAYCHFARIDSCAEELNRDGTLAREAEMAWNIQQALAERAPGAGPVLVVIGGFHAVAMPDLLTHPIVRPTAAKGTMATTSSALIRYTFERLDALNGYAAGMTSPAWHQLLWEEIVACDKAGLVPSAKIRQGAALTILFDIAGELRQRHSIELPMPCLAAAYEQVLQLAALRQRSAPLRDDVMDAVLSSFIKGEVDGDGATILATARRIFSGTTSGIVPPGGETPPLVRDFSRRARRQRLKIDDSELRRLSLDIYRRPAHRQTSRLLHSLVYLGVPFAIRTSGPDFVKGTGLERMLEHWEYAYSPVTEGSLVESSVYGETVARATATHFFLLLGRIDAAQRSADAACRWLIQSCLLGLHDYLPRLLAQLREAVASDSAFASVAGAAAGIGLLSESREPLAVQEVPEIPLLLQATFERAIYLGSQLPESTESASEVIEALSKLRELLVSAAGRELDGELYWNLLRELYLHRHNAEICGAATGLLHTSGRLSAEGVATGLSGFLAGTVGPPQAIAYLRGLLGTAREVAWQQPLLLESLDHHLARLDDSEFIALLPDLRLAFAAMTPNETDRIAAAVARRHGRESLGGLLHYDLTEEDVQTHLAWSTTVLEILADEGLHEWLAP